MLGRGYSPCLPSWPIKEIKLQGTVDGYEIDDLMVFVENPQSYEVRKLLVRLSITELIKYLQSDETADQKGLFHVEWAYLQLIDGHNEVRPKSLEIKLSNDPDFFSELIQLIFRSRKENHTQKDPTE
tara:strand:+ start:998 stop:1378 length:381 start_codon:yes stop_codon:yes gene_type:complete